MFKDLTKRMWFDTKYDVVNITVSKDSKHAIVILLIDDNSF